MGFWYLFSGSKCKIIVLEGCPFSTHMCILYTYITWLNLYIFLRNTHQNLPLFRVSWESNPSIQLPCRKIVEGMIRFFDMCASSFQSLHISPRWQKCLISRRTGGRGFWFPKHRWFHRKSVSLGSRHISPMRTHTSHERRSPFGYSPHVSAFWLNNCK